MKRFERPRPGCVTFVTMATDPVMTRLSEVYAELPRGERAIVRVLLDDYPFAALGSLRALADRANVSPPTASRLVSRLGFAGFADFQAAVRADARGQDQSRLRDFVTRAPRNDDTKRPENLRPAWTARWRP